METSKSPAQIIAGALALFRGGERWNNFTLKGMRTIDEKQEETFCALGALSQAANGKVSYPKDGVLKEAADIVAGCVPRCRITDCESDVYYEKPQDSFGIPGWNDTRLAGPEGFAQIKKVFCKALKVALERERPRAAKRVRKLKKKAA